MIGRRYKGSRCRSGSRHHRVFLRRWPGRVEIGPHGRRDECEPCSEKSGCGHQSRRGSEPGSGQAAVRQLAAGGGRDHDQQADIKIAAGAGSKGPDGPTSMLRPANTNIRSKRLNSPPKAIPWTSAPTIHGVCSSVLVAHCRCICIETPRECLVAYLAKLPRRQKLLAVLRMHSRKFRFQEPEMIVSSTLLNAIAAGAMALFAAGAAFGQQPAKTRSRSAAWRSH